MHRIFSVSTGRVRCCAGFIFSLLFAHFAAAQTNSTGWPFAGFDVNNSRWASLETSLNPANVGSVQIQWTFTAGNDVSATPSVDSSGNIYFPDWSGNLWKLSPSGALLWRQTMTGCGLPSNAISRTTPTLAGNYVLVGASAPLSTSGSSYAYLLALDPATGYVIWQVQLDPSSWAISTGSPIVYNNVVYIGVSSGGEKQSHPTFRGSLVAISLASGQVLWQTYMVPEGYSGGPIWSSTPVIDVQRSQIYVTTGNNYEVPLSVQQCEQAAQGNNQAVFACQSPANFEDSIVALDLASGAIKWGRHCSVDDAYLGGCHPARPGCPVPVGNDFDFGDGPHLFTATINGTPTQLVGAGQKSGKFWALNPSTGAVVWEQTVGPGGLTGGIQWGSASDNQQVYVAEANSGHKTYTLQPSGMSWNGGSWAALNAATGQFVWQVPDPGMDPVHPGEPSMAMGPVTVANGVVYCGSMSGAMYALNAATGATLWSFQAPGSVNAAPAVVNGWLYWGSGYGNFPKNKPIGTPSNTFYAFSVPAQ